MNDKISIRPFVNGDETEVSRVVCKTIAISNKNDYPHEFIEENVISHSPEVIAECAKDAHFYVAEDGEKIIGCGGITGYWGSETESYLLTIFVLPEYQGMGIGRKMGYTFKNGVTTPDEFNVVRLEKFNK